MKCAEPSLTPDANLDVELPLDVGEVCLRVREVIGIKSEGTPGTKLTDSGGPEAMTYHSYCFIQKQSRWKTRTGQLRSCIPCKKPATVSPEYDVKNDVDNQRPKVHDGSNLKREG